jgi:prepilin-type N-terminal cleavage/methylation domain-containing protein
MLFNLFSSNNKKSARACTRGFGLVELMVSISIMTLVSTVILVKNRSFNNALLLRNQAYEIAFTLRQAQLLAVSGTKESATSSNQYGVHFDIQTSSTDGKYRTFRDDINSGTNKGWYTVDDSTIGLSSLDSRYKIVDFIDSDGDSLDTDFLSVTFVRPNFDALFKTAAGTSFPGPVYIVISPRDSNYTVVPNRLIEVTSTGQISIQ